MVVVVVGQLQSGAPNSSVTVDEYVHSSAGASVVVACWRVVAGNPGSVNGTASSVTVPGWIPIYADAVLNPWKVSGGESESPTGTGSSGANDESMPPFGISGERLGLQM